MCPLCWVWLCWKSWRHNFGSRFEPGVWSFYLVALSHKNFQLLNFVDACLMKYFKLFSSSLLLLQNKLVWIEWQNINELWEYELYMCRWCWEEIWKLSADMTPCMKCFSHMLKKGYVCMTKCWLRDYTIVCYDAGYKSLTKTKCWVTYMMWFVQ